MATKWCTDIEVAKKRYPVVFQGHPSNFKVTREKNREFDPNGDFPGWNSSLNSPMATKWYTELEVVKERCPIVFQGHQSNFDATRTKNLLIWPKLRVSGLQLQIEFADGFEMTHSVWHSITEVSCCFSRSSVKFWRHTDKKSPNLTQIESFRTANPDWIHWWLWNEALGLT